MSDLHPQLEQLFEQLAEGGGPAVDHAQTCPECSAVLAEHKELERELFRISDPFPPAHFVSSVMAKVAAAPPPVRMDVKTGLAIMAGALVLAGVSFAALGGGVGALGLLAGQGALFLRDLFLGLGHALGALWKTAALPMMVALSLLLTFCLLALRKLAGDLSLSSSKVTS